MIYDLRKPDLSKAIIGDQVITSNGFMFERTEEGWKDVHTGLTWIGPIKFKGNWHETMKKFPNLPTKKEFEEGEKHGFREVLGINSGWFWSSSAYNDPYAWVFGGDDGVIFYGGRDDDYGEAVLAVRRPREND